MSLTNWSLSHPPSLCREHLYEAVLAYFSKTADFPVSKCGCCQMVMDHQAYSEIRHAHMHEAKLTCSNCESKHLLHRSYRA